MTADELFDYLKGERERAKAELGISEYASGYDAALDQILHKINPERWSAEC